MGTRGSIRRRGVAFLVAYALLGAFLGVTYARMADWTKPLTPALFAILAVLLGVAVVIWWMWERLNVPPDDRDDEGGGNG